MPLARKKAAAAISPARRQNWPKGSDGDAMHALLCGAGHKLRMILRHLRVLLLTIVARLSLAFAVLPASAVTLVPAVA